MENKNLATLVITLTVGVILAGSILMPVLDDAVTTSETFTNEGLVHLTKYGTDADLTISWDYTTPDILTVGDETVALVEGAYPLTAIGTDGFFMRYLTEDSITYFQLYDDGSGAALSANTSAGTNMDISISNGTVEATVGDTTETYTYDSFIFVVSDDGPYVMKASDEAAYVLGSSEIYGFGRSLVAYSGAATNINFSVYGSITEGFEITPISNSTTTEITEYTVTSAAVANTNDLYTFSKISFVSKNTDTDATATVVYSQVIVPYEVTAQVTDYSDQPLYAAIPGLIIMALLLAAAKTIVVKND